MQFVSIVHVLLILVSKAQSQIILADKPPQVFLIPVYYFRILYFAKHVRNASAVLIPTRSLFT